VCALPKLSPAASLDAIVEETVNAILAILNVFFRPAESVRRIQGNKLAWFPPILLGGLITAAYNHTLPRLTMQAMRNDPPAGYDAAKLDALVGSMESMARFSTIAGPLMFALMILIGAVLIFATCVLLRVNVKFPELYNVLAHVGLINALQTLAHLLVLRGKGAAISTKDLTPNFGLASQLPPGSPKVLEGLAGFFSVFTMWHIVILALGFAALARIPTARAFLVTAPSWMIGLMYALIVTLGAAQR
jgi:hypothetical protein